MTDNPTLLLRIRSQFKRLEQVTWTIRELQNRFPLGVPENEENLLKGYLEMIYDVEDILNELKELKKEYAK